MTTIHELLDRARADAVTARRADVRAKAAAEAARADLGLREAWEDTSTHRRAADGRVAALAFEAELDAWTDRAQRARHGDGFVDEQLVALADGDPTLIAALHVKRAGVAVPAGWRSPAGNRA